MNSRTVICIAGPTCTGKSATATTLAQKIDGIIINADSRQLYRDFPIITAQPTKQERSLCPHLLYGILGITETSTAGMWSSVALKAIEDTLAQNKIPILVGGTGMYMRAIFDGIVDIPPIPQAIQSEIETEFDFDCGTSLYAELHDKDPSYAQRIHPHDRQRLTRAIGVLRSTGKTFSWWHTQTPPPAPYHVIRLAIGVSLFELEPQIATRIDQMLADGAFDEAQRASHICDNPSAPAWSGIGCAELYSVLKGTLTLDEARILWIKNTRAYAKRQLTWFRADKRFLWFTPRERQKLIDTACNAL